MKIKCRSCAIFKSNQVKYKVSINRNEPKCTRDKDDDDGDEKYFRKI